MSTPASTAGSVPLDPPMDHYARIRQFLSAVLPFLDIPGAPPTLQMGRARQILTEISKALVRLPSFFNGEILTILSS